MTVLAILGCHEMGHYFVVPALRGRRDAPVFSSRLPRIAHLVGTLGAFIRIRSRIPTKIALFDIGIAGPIAGFLVAVPALFIGLSMSRLVRGCPMIRRSLIELGEPLLFQFAAWLIWGPWPRATRSACTRWRSRAWFGLLATALNLFPISQLDGGHICYAVLGRRSTLGHLPDDRRRDRLDVRLAQLGGWTVLLVVMILMLGPHHPPTFDEHEPLDRGRLILAGFALLMLLVCFTPAPIGAFVGR